MHEGETHGGFWCLKKRTNAVIKVWRRRWLTYGFIDYDNGRKLQLRYWLSRQDADKPCRGELVVDSLVASFPSAQDCAAQEDGGQGSRKHQPQISISATNGGAYLLVPEHDAGAALALSNAWDQHITQVTPAAVANAVLLANTASQAVAAFALWDTQAVAANAALEIEVVDRQDLTTVAVVEATQLMKVGEFKVHLEEMTGVQAHAQQLFSSGVATEAEMDDSKKLGTELDDDAALCEIGLESAGTGASKGETATATARLVLGVMEAHEMKVKESLTTLMNVRRMSSLPQEPPNSPPKSPTTSRRLRHSRLLPRSHLGHSRSASADTGAHAGAHAMGEDEGEEQKFYVLKNKLVSKASLADMYNRKSQQQDHEHGQDQGTNVADGKSTSKGKSKGKAGGKGKVPQSGGGGASRGGGHRQKRASLQLVEKFVAKDAFLTPYTKEEMRALAAVFSAHCDGEQTMTYAAFRPLFDVDDGTCAEIFSLFDENCSGTLDMKEFLAGFSMRRSTFDELRFSDKSMGRGKDPSSSAERTVRSFKSSGV